MIACVVSGAGSGRSQGSWRQRLPADGCQDHLISLAIGESLRTGAGITTGREAWSG